MHNLTGDTGSPIYMAPEVFKKQMYNEKADVFSFGVMMYETFGRTLLVFTHIGDGRNCFQTTGEAMEEMGHTGEARERGEGVLFEYCDL